MNDYGIVPVLCTTHLVLQLEEQDCNQFIEK